MQSLVMDGVVRRRAPVMEPVLARPDSRPLPAPPYQRPVSARLMNDIQIQRPMVPTAPPLMALIDQPASPGWQFNLRLTPAIRPYLWALPALALIGTSTLALNRLRHSTLTQSPRAAIAQSVPAAAAAPAPAANPAPAEQTATAALAAATAQLQQLLASIAPNIGASNGIVIKDLKTGAEARSGDQQVFTSASLYKLFVAHATYRAIDNGGLTLGSPAGNGRTVGDCLNLMITISDNGCGEALGAKLGWDKYNSTLTNLGFSHTSLGQPLKTTAGDVALLLERLYQGTLLSPNTSTQFLDLLKAQKVNNRLPQGLPAGTVIAHKTGDLDGFVHDAGIVYGPKTDYLVVMTTGPWASPANAPTKFADLSAKLYAHFNQ